MKSSIPPHRPSRGRCVVGFPGWPVGGDEWSSDIRGGRSTDRRRVGLPPEQAVLLGGVVAAGIARAGAGLEHDRGVVRPRDSTDVSASGLLSSSTLGGREANRLTTEFSGFSTAWGSAHAPGGPDGVPQECSAGAPNAPGMPVKRSSAGLRGASGPARCRAESPAPTGWSPMSAPAARAVLVNR
jgi:hypothetical protein